MDAAAFALGASALLHAGLLTLETAEGGVKVGFVNEKKDPFSDALCRVLSRNGG